MIHFALKTDKTLRWNFCLSVCMNPHIHHVTLISDRVYYSWFLRIFFISTLWTYATEVVSLNKRLIICFARELTAGVTVTVRGTWDVKSARRDKKCHCTFKTNDHKITFFFCEWPSPPSMTASFGTLDRIATEQHSKGSILKLLRTILCI
jgi:hypothetical protein